MVNRALPSPDFWHGKRVFVTGHTGFKGGWLCLWLSKLGAEVSGYALAPSTTPSFFTACGVDGLVHHTQADIRDAEKLCSCLQDFKPDVVFHLAAQPLVRASYAQPLETYSTNIMGTAYLLAAVAETPSVQATIIVTSDKVYAESNAAHTEDSPLGGHDPYSASKACTELVAASYPLSRKPTTVRAGNVIGGGDWSADRLVPDFFRAQAAGEALVLRNPTAIRPWQHVLEPLCGYLLAAESMFGKSTAENWNFGPGENDEASVEAVIHQLSKLVLNAHYEIDSPTDAPHEAPVLRLNAEKAHRELSWHPRWRLDRALYETAAWHRAHLTSTDMRAFTLSQIEAYCHHD